MVLLYKILKKICNPSLLSWNYFVLSNLHEKMALYVPFFITSNRKLNLEGFSAFKRMPPRRNKIWEISLFWLLRAASSSYEPPVLPPPHSFPARCKFSAAAAAKIMCYISFILFIIII